MIVESFQQQRDAVRDSLRHAPRLTTQLVNITSAHTSDFTQLFRDLLARPDAQPAAVQQALVTMQATLADIAERQEADETQRAALIESLQTLKAQSPTLLEQLTRAVQGVGSGVVANLITAVLRQHGLMP